MDFVTILLVLVLLALLGLAGVVWRTQKSGGAGDKAAELLLQQLGELRRDVDSKLGESTKTVNESMRDQSRESQRLIKEITEELTKVKETGRRVEGFADQLQRLQDILQNPKQRGALGEYYLEKVLQDVFAPGQYETQYQFKNGDAVDAVLFLQDKILPIDSKFSLENYRRLIETTDQTEREKLEKVFVNDLKLRIKETAKYIRPDEGTMDFAFMFIPSEAIYYDLLSSRVGAVREVEENLIQRAANQYKVLIVSPTTFLAYLQTVLQGLRQFEIQEHAKQIQKNVGRLRDHLMRQDDAMQRLGKTLGTTVSHYDKAYKQLRLMGTDVKRITGKSHEIEELSIEKPRQE